MSTLTSWGFPQYTGELFEVGGKNTAFLTMMGGLNSGLIVNAFDFPMSSAFSLSSPSQPAITETASLTAPAATNYTRNQVLNTVQIYMETIDVSYVAQSTYGAITADLANNLTAAGTNSITDLVAWQIEKALKQIARDADYTALNGAYQQATSASVAAKTRGIIPYITTNSGIGLGTQGALDKDSVDAVLMSMADAGAPFDQPVAFVNAFQKVQLSNLYTTSMALAPRDRNVGGVNVTTIVTDFCDLDVVYCANMPTDKILIADMAYVRPVICPVPGKGGLFYEELSRTGAAVQGQLYVQLGFDFGPESYHGIIKALPTS